MATTDLQPVASANHGFHTHATALSEERTLQLLPEPQQRPQEQGGRSSTPPHLSHDPSSNAKQSAPFEFGQRYLTDTSDPFSFNAWDHVLPDAEHDAYCESQYSLQRSAPVSDFDYKRFNGNPEKWWNLFYKQKQNTFFKDRKWLRQEFPVLAEITQKGSGRKRVLEVGAGAGNTVFPILRGNENEELFIYAYDFSKTAVKTMRDDAGYDERFMRAEVWDVAQPDIDRASQGGEEGAESRSGTGSDSENGGLPPGIEPESLDVVIMIFIFSALNPRQWAQAVKNIWRVLKPGGQVLFRDYGRGDLAQVRFKAGRWMEENFYVRGDGTRVYFFEKEQLEQIWRGGAGAGIGTESKTGDTQTPKEVDRQRQSNGSAAAAANTTSTDTRPKGATAQDKNSHTTTPATDGLSEPGPTAVEASTLLTSSSSSTSGTIAAPAPAPVENPLQQHDLFEIADLDVDRRMIVNRQRRIKMYRCWIQGRFIKPA